MDRFLELLRNEFEQIILTKTGWGKNEIMIVFDKASIKAIIKYAKEKQMDLT